MLNVVNLEAERDDRVLFAHLTFDLNPGEILQIKGRNGAGKTTLLKILAGLTHDYSGDIAWCGQSLARNYGEFRLATTFLGHKSGVKPELTPIENLTWRHQLSGRVNTLALEDALNAVNLQGYENIPCHQLSAGQQRRVALASLLTSGARFWILDEPFTALDVEGASWLEGVIEQHARQQGLTLLTSHQPLSVNNLKTVTLEGFPGGCYDD